MNRKTFKKIFGVLLLGVVISPVFVNAQSPASLSIVPATGTYPVGEPFTIEVRIDTGGQAIGTADATITYDPNDISYLSFSDTGSVFSTILVDTTRDDGTLDVSGLIERGREPFVGDDGRMIQVTFVPLRNIATQLFLKGGATLPLTLGASVGSLTNIISQVQSASYSFVPKERLPANVPIAFAQESFVITPLPAIENEWFATSTVTLSWTVPEDATAMRTGVTTSPEGTFEKTYDTPVTSETITGLSEGEQYFLLQFMKQGQWGEVNTYPVRVDMSDPSYVTLKETERTDPSDPRVAFIVDSNDAFSGIAYFEMSIDGEEGERWEPTEDKIYTPDGLTPGEHVLSATAFDKAGNSTSTEVVFLVRALESPTLYEESVPKRVLVGDSITIRGSSYPDSEVTVYVSLNEGEAVEHVVETDARGDFVATVTDGARAGTYTMWFTVTDARGATSPNSIRRSIEVTQPYIMLFGTIAVTYLSVIVPLLGLVALLILVLWLMYTWIRGYRGRVRRETKEAFYSTQEEFENLREELIRQIGMLEKANLERELTREEMRIFTDLSKRLDKIERHIQEEIEDIEYVEMEEKKAVERTRTVEGSLEEYRNKLSKNEHKVTINESHVIRL